MKKVVSIFIVLQMMLSLVTIASAAVHGEYTAIDMPSECLTSKAFLSESTAGTITDSETVYPHFFMGSGKGKAYAISKESIDGKLTDGVLEWNGIPFKVVTLDNQKSAMGSTSNKVVIPTGYYSKVYVLTVGSPDYTGDNTIYRGMLGPDKSGETSMNLTSSQYVTDLAWAKVKSTDDLSGKANPKLMVETFEITDKTSRFNKISFWLQADASKRILAVTTEGLKGNEWNPIIEAKIAKLPTSILSADFNVAAFDEVTSLIETANKTGADTDSISGIEKYNSLKNEISAKVVSVESYTENTDSDKISVDINFTTAVAEASAIKNNFSVLSGDMALDFKIEKIINDGKITGIRIITENKLNYSDEIKIVVKKNISNADDEKFTMSEDYEISFKPTAPTIYIKDFNCENGSVSVNLVNNDKLNSQDYVLTLGHYSADNRMKDSRVFTGTIGKDGIEIKYDFQMSEGDFVGCFLLDSFLTMNYLNCPIVK